MGRTRAYCSYVGVREFLTPDRSTLHGLDCVMFDDSDSDGDSDVTCDLLRKVKQEGQPLYVAARIGVWSAIDEPEWGIGYDLNRSSSSSILD